MSIPPGAQIRLEGERRESSRVATWRCIRYSDDATRPSDRAKATTARATNAGPTGNRRKDQVLAVGEVVEEPRGGALVETRQSGELHEPERIFARIV
jgi:hypothetical protein